MRIEAARVGRARAVWAWAAMAAIVWALAGCATRASEDSTSNLTDHVSPADEPDNRKRARIRLELAVNYFGEGKTEIALEEIKQALATDPTLVDALVVRGLIYMRLNDLRQAEDSFRRAVAINPRDANAHHNYGWLQCQLGRYPESLVSFQQAMANPLYPDRAKTLMAQGLCQARAGRKDDAELSLARSYELDPLNPITGYNLAQLLFQRGEMSRAQFYIRRLNNSELANSESLWLGIKVERRMNDNVAMQQLGDQLRKRFPQSRERSAYDRGAFDE
jgi:type IV pilus assembly protein PilF